MDAAKKALGILGGSLGILLGSISPSIAAPCLLSPTDSAEKANLKVYFTQFKKEDRTNGKYRNCRLVSSKTKGAVFFYVTPFRQDAEVVVHRRNWPRK